MTRNPSENAFLTAFGLLCLASLPGVCGGRVEDVGPATVQELFDRSAGAYQSGKCLEITLTTSVEIPPGDPEERVVRYLLGTGREAILEIGSLMRVVVTKDAINVERLGLQDRVLHVSQSGDDLGAALAAVRGEFPLAGFWEPPQAALRQGKTQAGVLEAFRYSSLLGELSVADFGATPGSTYEVRLEAANGSCVARFDPDSYHLVEVEYTVEPPEKAAGHATRIRGFFTTREVDRAETLFAFDPGDRKVVESLRDLSASPPGVNQPPESIVTAEALAARLLSVEELGSALRETRVLLVGEDHLYEEPPAYTAKLLEKLGDRPVSLMIEMPRDTQADIDEYLETGNEEVLARIFSGKPVLQLQHLLRWAHHHRERVPTVEAFDEPLEEIRFRRAYAVDTRNATMARAIHRQWSQHPDRRVVAYAGQLHMLRAGRYLVDQPSRDSAGSRLPGLGIPPDEIISVMLNGGESFHLHAIWSEQGALPIDGRPSRIPIAYLIDYPIYGVEFADEAFDYFVNLGPLTEIEVDPE